MPQPRVPRGGPSASRSFFSSIRSAIQVEFRRNEYGGNRQFSCGIDVSINSCVLANDEISAPLQNVKARLAIVCVINAPSDKCGFISSALKIGIAFRCDRTTMAASDRILSFRGRAARKPIQSRRSGEAAHRRTSFLYSSNTFARNSHPEFRF
ncbi:hypothetical protein [Burkholderia multivorans]|uniref:hypothetical protein n=1 Tax=Burkholderia multivorans TaxID=87883 RepID=UPI0021BE9292|nr:hypothetical protein [Burkholderia multivorans]